MNDEEQTKSMLLGAISTLNPGQQKIVRDTTDAIHKLVKEAGDGLGIIALALAEIERQEEM